MCGIVGYVGNQNACNVLISGLEKLEYRGYDSAGIALCVKGDIQTFKAEGKLFNLKNKIKPFCLNDSTMGIGHTRWATHGEPNEVNAHPHHSNDGMVHVVHNGIIENFLEIKNFLIENNYHFYSDTDTEVLSNLIDFEIKQDINYKKIAKFGKNDLKNSENIIKSIQNALFKVRGSYALAIMVSGLDDKIFVAKNESPLILGKGNSEFFVASDVPALLKYTRQVAYLENGDLGVVSKNNIKIYDKNLKEKTLLFNYIDWDLEAAEKNGYPHFMLKEIFEEPKTVADTLNSLCHEKNGSLEFDFDQSLLDGVSNVLFIGCGSAFHVGLGLTYVFEKLTGLPARAILASEFRYNDHIFDKHTLVVSISQSGETADTLSGIMLAKSLGLKTLSIVNVRGSSIARASDQVVYTQAGMEIAVATTKAYSCQLIAGYVLALAFAKKLNRISQEKLGYYYQELQKIPKIIEKTLKIHENLKEFAKNIYNKSFLYMIGRGIDYAICRESALKMKEVSYISTEAFPAGELKHGTISLVEPGTFVFGFLTQENTLDKTLSNLLETKCRGAKIVGVGYKLKHKNNSLDCYIEIPNNEPLFSNIIAIVPMQLLSYYVSVLRKNDVDKPRNLAKSVTVE